MPIYMLNLVFDASTIVTNATGRFNDYVNTGQGQDPLQLSKAWLTPQANVTNPDPNNPSDWQLFQEDTGTGFTLHKTAQITDQIQIRVLGLNLPSQIVAHMTTIISRNTPEAKQQININPDTKKPYQQYASPFKLTDGGPCCVFDYVNPDYLSPTPYNPVANAGSWLQLTNPQGSPPVFEPVALVTPNRPAGWKDAYTVVVALVTGGYVTQQVYSHDPDCNVEC